MKKIMLTTLLALMSSQSFAALTSHGSATTSMTLNAPAIQRRRSRRNPWGWQHLY